MSDLSPRNSADASRYWNEPWRHSLACHDATPRAKPPGPADALVTRAETWMKTLLEIWTTRGGRSAVEARDLHARLMTTVVQLAKLHLAGGLELDDMSTDLATSVRVTAEKLRNMEESNNGK